MNDATQWIVSDQATDHIRFASFVSIGTLGPVVMTTRETDWIGSKISKRRLCDTFTKFVAADDESLHGIRDWR